MPANGDKVPDADHALRYVDKKFVDRETGVVDGSGFLGRLGEGPPSVNWMECFPLPIENQIAEIRAVKRIRYEKRGRLVRINVGQTVKHLAENSVALSIVHDTLGAADGKPADPSHALMRGVPEITTSEGDFVKDLLRECIINIYEPVPD